MFRRSKAHVRLAVTANKRLRTTLMESPNIRVVISYKRILPLVYGPRLLHVLTDKTEHLKANTAAFC